VCKSAAPSYGNSLAAGAEPKNPELRRSRYSPRRQKWDDESIGCGSGRMAGIFDRTRVIEARGLRRVRTEHEMSACGDERRAKARRKITENLTLGVACESVVLR
jgi:hypothetical protein